MSVNSEIQTFPRGRILLLEDDDGVRRSLQLLLQGLGFEVRSFAAATPALADPLSAEMDFLIADNRLPDGDGLSALRTLRARGWQGRAILITAFPSSGVSEAAEQAGFAAVLEKPLRQQVLLGALTR
ncbi:response regulator [Sphingomonas sp. dw_22]|uniref:response regulator n=1 Tax=Sphingomonas sp. dw_22 TaxID=2721175 RepID=UPI001BD314A2|nr:response regulator [Sphingomonas sp. dw_22]